MSMKATHSYAGYAKCGCLVAVTVDSPENFGLARDLKEFIETGLTVERITMDKFRASHLGHSCGKTATQLELK